VSAASGRPAVRIGTRGSALAIAQARLVATALERAGTPCELREVVTQGDVRAPDTAWGEGAFVGALEQALLGGEVDVAVHSAKDMPTDEDRRLATVAYLPRADASDALVPGRGRPLSLAAMPEGASIGTDSPRRAGFLRAWRRDLDVRPLYGNVDTRLRRLDEGEVDALVLAAAGLERLGRADRIGQRFGPRELPPAPGQGAIAVQARADDRRVAELCAALDDAGTRLAVESERAFLAATGGGCRAPVGALATVEGQRIRLIGGFATLDGAASAVHEVEGGVEEALALARELADRLVARRLALADRGRVLVTRSGRQSERLVARLVEHGLRAQVVPAVDIRLPDDTRPLERELRALAGYSWAVVTSANGAHSAVEAARRARIDLRVGRWAAVGRATAAVLHQAGVAEVWLPSRAGGAFVGDELPIGRRTSVLLLRGNLADTALPARLAERGAEVRELVVYETVEAPASSRPALERALGDDPPLAVVLASPSAVRGLLALAGSELRRQVLGIPALCIGPVTAAAAREHGFLRVAQAAEQDAAALADLAAQLIAGGAVARQ
jgi:hydroxymethylbilane synthase